MLIEVNPKSLKNLEQICEILFYIKFTQVFYNI